LSSNLIENKLAEKYKDKSSEGVNNKNGGDKSGELVKGKESILEYKLG
jgi:hypothetical protein